MTLEQGQHAVPLQFEHEPCHDNLRDSVAPRKTPNGRRSRQNSRRDLRYGTCPRSERRNRLPLNQLEQDATCRFRMDKDVAIALGSSLDVFRH